MLGFGARNGRVLRLALGTVVVLLVLYLLFSWRNDAQKKARYLATAEVEYNNLLKRFGHLQEDLRVSLQKHAELAESLKKEQANHIVTINDKKDEEEKCKKDKDTLTDQLQSLRADRETMSHKVQTLTSEMADAREHADSEYQALSATCTTNQQKCEKRATAAENELTVIKEQNANKQHLLQQCNQELSLSQELVATQNARIAVLERDSVNSNNKVEQLQSQLNRVQSEKDMVIGNQKSVLANPGNDRVPPLEHKNGQQDHLNEAPRVQKTVLDGDVSDREGREQGDPKQQLDLKSEWQVYRQLKKKAELGEKLTITEQQVLKILSVKLGLDDTKERPGIEGWNAKMQHVLELDGVKHQLQEPVVVGNEERLQQEHERLQQEHAARKESMEEEVKDLLEGHQKANEFDNVDQDRQVDKNEVEEGGAGGHELHPPVRGNHDNDQKNVDDEKRHDYLNDNENGDDERLDAKENPLPNPVHQAGGVDDDARAVVDAPDPRVNDFDFKKEKIKDDEDQDMYGEEQFRQDQEKFKLERERKRQEWFEQHDRL